MKKITQRQRCWIAKQAQRNRTGLKTKNITKKRKVKTLIFQNKFSLFIPSQRQLIIEMIESMKNATYSNYYIDFRKTKKLEPLTILYLLHQLHQYKDVKFRSRNFKETMHKAVFKRLELNPYFRLPNINHHTYNKWVDDWHLFSGENTNFSPELRQHLLDINQKYGKISFKLITGITEAISNVIHHAYPNTTSNKRWFLLSHIDVNAITVVVSDLGVTIPVTTPLTLQKKLKQALFTLPDVFQQLNSVRGTKRTKPINTTNPDLKGLSDSEVIGVATTLNHTSTNISGRGKGFNDIFELAVNAKQYPDIAGINTTILSRYGSYILTATAKGLHSASLNKRLDDFDTKVEGTIISWTIQLNDQTGQDNEND